MAPNENAIAIPVAAKTAKETVNHENEYTSVAINRGYEVDVLSQFKANLQQVEELNQRLRFTLTEVSSLLK